MYSLRRLLLGNRLFAGAILALALAMKIAMPAGVMPAVSEGRIVISICSGTGPAEMAVAIPGRDQGKSDPGHAGKGDQPCAFAGLSAPSLAGADPVLLAAAILFILALGLRPLVVPASAAPAYLRPPLRGPPALI